MRGAENLERAPVAADQGRSAAVSEERARDQIRDAHVTAQVGHRGDLDGDDRDLVVRISQKVIVGVRDSHSSSGATQLGEGKPLGVRAHPEVVDEIGVERRDHETGTGGGDENVDVGGRDRALFQQFPQELDAELLALFDVDIVTPLERVVLEKGVDVSYQVAVLHSGVAEQAERLVEKGDLAFENIARQVDHPLLGELMRRQSGGNAINEAQDIFQEK